MVTNSKLSTKITYKPGRPFLLPLFNILLKFYLMQYEKKGKKKIHRLEGKKNNHFLLAYDMIVYVENKKELTKISTGISDYTKIASYKIYKLI